MIFIDYNGKMGKRRHNGGHGFPAGDGTLVLMPGAQGIDRDLWNKARTCHSIGWTKGEGGKGSYKSEMWTKGYLKELPATKDGSQVDWSKVDQASLFGLDGLISRTVHPVIHESLRRYAHETDDADLLEEVTRHLDDVLTDFSGNKIDVLTAQRNVVQAA